MSDLPAHPAVEELQAFGDAELAAFETERVRAHLVSCGECRTRLEELRAASGAYAAFHSGELKAAMPSPPRPWEDIRWRMAEMDARRPRRLRVWLATAAILLVCVAVARRFQHPPGVSASELLLKASAAESAEPPRPHRRIRVKTNRETFVRAVPPAAQAASDAYLPALFASARFNWDNPLSAVSFAEWRDGLPEKHDQVTSEAAFHHIRTTTPHGVLAAATLSLRAADLRPVRETLEFRNSERVEITEALDAAPVAAAPATPPPPAHPARPAAPPAPPLAAVTRELRVLAALHDIGADLGDPVEVGRRGSEVVVTGTGLDARKREQVRATVSAVPGVELRFEEAPPAPAPSPGNPARRSTSRVPEFATQLEEDVSLEQFINTALDASDAVLARAYALRSLAERFPAEVEADLSAPDAGLLESLRRNHREGLRDGVRALAAALAPVLPGYTSGGAAPAGTWQDRAGRLLDAARDVDRLLNMQLAGSGGGSREELAAALRRLEAEAAP